MQVSLSLVRIKKAIEKAEDCFLCSLETEIEQKYVNAYLYELVMNPKAREDLVKSRGFCNYHFYKMLAVATRPSSHDGHGLALILKSVIEEISRDIDKQQKSIEKTLKTFAENRNSKFFLKRKKKESMFFLKEQKMLAAETSCPACVHISSFILDYIEEFTENLVADEELEQLFDKSDGLCVPHYAAALWIALQNADRKKASIKKLVDVEKRGFKHLECKLAEYIDKQDHRFSDKERAHLHDVVFRGVTKLVGNLGTKVRG